MIGIADRRGDRDDLAIAVAFRGCDRARALLAVGIGETHHQEPEAPPPPNEPPPPEKPPKPPPPPPPNPPPPQPPPRLQPPPPRPGPQITTGQAEPQRRPWRRPTAAGMIMKTRMIAQKMSGKNEPPPCDDRLCRS